MNLFKRLIIVLILTVLVLGKSAMADEGMWLLMYLNKNYSEMKAKGLKLSPEDIYDINNSSLKDAIVSLRFCTAEIVSAEGLMLTNHHCSHQIIQSHSTVDHDYLTDGFWAKSKKEELQANGVTASILIRMDDVTGQINNVAGDIEDIAGKAAAIQEEIVKIKAEAEKDNFYRAEVRSMFARNQYFLFVYETYTDVRLVGAPPSSIGKFGGDADNWEWPRHTGDFSLLRIYMSPEGEPAAYSEENIPYQPRHFLPINIKGVNDGDFSMVMGFPGRTQRYLTSHGIELAQNVSNPVRIKIRTKMLNLMKDDMEKDAAIRIKYASIYSRIANYWKYFIGQNEGLERLETVSGKRKMEDAFQMWADSKSKTKKKYGSVLSGMKAGYEELAKTELFVQGINEAVFTPQIIQNAWSFRGLKNAMEAEEPDQEKIDGMVAELKSSVPGRFNDYNKSTEINLLAAGMELFYDITPKEQMPAHLASLNQKYKGDWDKYAAKTFSKSIFGSEQSMMDYLDNPSLKKLMKDPIAKFIDDMYDTYLKTARDSRTAANAQIRELSKTLVAGLMEMEPEKSFYPDANSTIRLTYGNVESYVPKDAISYKHFTTIEGIMEKEDPNDDEFIVPEGLMELFEKKDFGNYGSNGTLPVCFITNNDITGGNSGSPVIDGSGNLIGIAFDGNWEAMTGDLVYDKEYKRCINVDIRYVMFIIDKYAGAQNIIDEMKIVK